MSWSKDTWQTISPIYNRIIKMPFIEELMDGSLPLEKFQFYMSQDSAYLENFGRALALIGARAYDTQNMLTFLQFAENAIIVESALHESYFKEFGVSEKAIVQPACHHYINFLKSTAALDNLEVAMAAVLPCFWIYKAVGDYILENQKDGENTYQAWIDTYAGEEFGEAVTKAIQICDEHAEKTTPQIRARMTEAFVTASNLEYHFWDAGYSLRTW
ncbi:thiaminase II [Zunongwangia endophytica]|uniref:Aminopyrimidine aminohydrolase n=1 Tax=Zunongwangia endophytica TaxID=1808945 RepID=A0ABV8HAQ3_9FLAO|nr:thiaminase II [Zunongwangia endophytica]MDN3593745.1 thiaminase II [Zunongwangia endophytica]